MNTNGEREKQQPAPHYAMRSNMRKRPDVTLGFTRKAQTGLEAMYLTVNEVDGQLFKVFATIGKSGCAITAKAEAISRLVSLGACRSMNATY
jgi:hypothetical protein